MKPEATLALMWPGGAQEMEDGMVLTLHVQLRPQEAKVGRVCTVAFVLSPDPSCAARPTLSCTDRLLSCVQASAAKPKEEPKKGELASGERSQGCACVIM